MGRVSPLSCAAALSLAATTSACVTIAAPVRTGQYGAPGRMDAGMVEAGGGVNYGPVEVSGGPLMGYGVTESVAVEGGAEVGQTRVMGWGGVRYTPLRPEGRDLALVLDIEGGAGAGVQSRSLPAGGGYLGLGVGGKLKFFYPWMRVRTQVTGAEGVPVTSTTTANLGVQFSIAEFAHLYASSGAYFVATSEFRAVGWMIVDGGLSFTIPTPRTHDARQRRTLGADGRGHGQRAASRRARR